MAKYDREQFLATAGSSKKPYTTGVCVCVCVCERERERDITHTFSKTLFEHIMIKPLHFIVVLVSGVKQGILYKRMKQSEVWNGRWFVLADRQLSYYKSYHVR